MNAVDAHHIFNRNLFTGEEEKGGYFMENGAQLCSYHHYQAEATHITTKDLWGWCDILTPAIPIQLDKSYSYDTWGNRIINEWSRLPGPLFHDEGFQKLLTRENLSWLFQTVV